MTDMLAAKEVIPVEDLPNILPKKRGRKLHYSTVYRWCSRGCRGVKLETFLYGGTICTTPEAITQFFERLNATRSGSQPTPTRTPAARRRASEAAARELERMGV